MTLFYRNIRNDDAPVCLTKDRPVCLKKDNTQSKRK